eukprot:TRINITY_DN32405_c0_g1_i1.p1 TRINITY_DN32405_c0_g1~~TRINITY_DN32405_c0_g1_i1.p1  ORF type:complete len:562 (-),score=43.26 TRINITY_DN32405_c0_g1_i1:461-2146(-)
MIPDLGVCSVPSDRAAELHRQVDKDRWCVTKADIKDFRRRILAAIKKGDVQPTDLDSFDINDDRIGPTVKTVNEQYIKPITREAGNMSWALMLHPQGLKCDLYITHAWEEGIFEFIDKVLSSWPRRARHAYCCFLSNPQNLDINALISNPRQSPFATSLLSARYMLVVPNQRSTVFRRMWCVYEAFLAYESGKRIRMARSSEDSRAITLAAVRAVMCCVAGVLTGWIWNQCFGLTSFTDYLTLYAWFTCSCGFISVVSHGFPVLRRAVHLLGSMLGGVGCGATIPNAVENWSLHSSLTLVLLSTFGSLFFVVSEADRVRDFFALAEAEQLSNGYMGDVRMSHCTVEQDAISILTEIGDRTSEVDSAIRVLIKAGMWSESLRVAVEAGVDVEGAGRVDLAPFCGGAILPVVASAYLCTLQDPMCTLLAVFQFALSILCTSSHFFLPRDRHAFGTKAASKIGAGWILSFLIIYACFHKWSIVAMARTQGAAMVITSSVYLFVLLSGIHRIAKYPVVGPRLAQLLIARFSGRNLQMKDLRPSETNDRFMDIDLDIDRISFDDNS